MMSLRRLPSCSSPLRVGAAFVTRRCMSSAERNQGSSSPVELWTWLSCEITSLRIPGDRSIGVWSSSWRSRIPNLTDDQKTMAMAAGFAVVAFSMWKWQHDKPFARAYENTHCEENTADKGTPGVVAVVDKLPEDFDLRSGAVKISLYHVEYQVRGVLDYHRLPYKLVEVHPLTKAETKSFAPDYKKVPLVTFECNGRMVQMRNSSDIVAAVAGAMGTVGQPSEGKDIVKAPIPTPRRTPRMQLTLLSARSASKFRPTLPSTAGLLQNRCLIL